MQHAYARARVPDWTAAECRNQDPELFFPVGTGEPARRQVDRARAVCSRCTIATECLEWAVASGIDEGVWGGLSAEQRRARRTVAPRIRAF